MKFITAMVALVMSSSLLADVSPPQIDGCIVEGSEIHLMGKLINETFTETPLHANKPVGNQPETYWVLSTEKSYCGEGYNSKTKVLYRIEDAVSRFQLILKPEHYDDQRELVGKKVIVEGKIVLANLKQHHTKILIDVKTIESASCNSGSIS